ncbi:hypothetical protein D3C78_1467940 [compost metagenome]
MGGGHFERWSVVQNLPLAFAFQCPFRLARRLMTQHVFERVIAVRCKSRVLQIDQFGIGTDTLHDDPKVLPVDLYRLA